MRKFLKNKKRNRNFFVEPDEIFLDSTNLPEFDTQQFEGRLEKPIRKNSITFIGIFFMLFVTLFSIRLGNLQIKKGEAYYDRSEKNTLQQVILFADRGIIYDRNGVELAWNKKDDEDLSTEEFLSEQEILTEEELVDEDPGFSARTYLSPGFSHVLGYVKSPDKDSSGKYWQTEFDGVDGLEKIYNERLQGVNGSKLIETDARGTVHSENVINPPERGAGLYTTIDSRIQQKLFSIIKKASEDYNFLGGAGVLMNIENGEILTSTSYPEYDSNVLSLGEDTEKIQGYLTDKRKVFMDKTISGLYTPGSIVKPFFALGALAEGIIDPYKSILSTGSISIPNPYDKTKESVFKDWKAHGYTDMSEAIAVSSDVYFYAIGGGYKDQKGLGISNLEKYARLFNIGSKTGVDLPDETSGTIPSPEWKAKIFNGDIWRIGDTYHTSIGQYGFQVTPMEMVRAVAALANFGKLVTPHFILNDTEKNEQISKIDLPNSYFTEVQKGMREAVTYGTAVALNLNYVDIAAKSGTAQVGIKKDKVNSWVIGFFPYENPKYAFTIMMEQGPSSGTVSASSILRQLFEFMKEKTPEYFE